MLKIGHLEPNFELKSQKIPEILRFEAKNIQEYQIRARMGSNLSQKRWMNLNLRNK